MSDELNSCIKNWLGDVMDRIWGLYVGKEVEALFKGDIFVLVQLEWMVVLLVEIGNLGNVLD